MIKLSMTSENFLPEISLGRQGIPKLDSYFGITIKIEVQMLPQTL